MNIILRKWQFVELTVHGIGEQLACDVTKLKL